jgi:hypothetical protein
MRSKADRDPRPLQAPIVEAEAARLAGRGASRLLGTGTTFTPSRSKARGLGKSGTTSAAAYPRRQAVRTSAVVSQDASTEIPPHDERRTFRQAVFPLCYRMRVVTST